MIRIALLFLCIAASALAQNVVPILPSNLSAVYPITSYGAKMDVQEATPAITLSGSSLTVSTGTWQNSASLFTSTDVGKAIILTGCGTSGTQGGAWIGTITGYTSATQITLSGSPSCPSYANGGQYLLWGTDDTTAINSAITAAINNHGGDVIIPEGKFSLALGAITIGDGNAKVNVIGSYRGANLYLDGQAAVYKQGGGLFGTPQSSGAPAFIILEHSTIRGVEILNSTVPYATATGAARTWRMGMDALRSYNGYGVWIGNYTGGTNGSDIALDENLIVGFGTGVNSPGTNGRLYLRRNLIDAWNGVSITNSAANGIVESNTIYGESIDATVPSWSVTAINNSGGAIQIVIGGNTVTTANAFLPGDPITLTNITGTNMTGVNARYIVRSVTTTSSTQTLLLDIYTAGLGDGGATTFPAGGSYTGSGGYAQFNPAVRPGTAISLVGTETGVASHQFPNNAVYGNDVIFATNGTAWTAADGLTGECVPEGGGLADPFTVGIQIGNTNNIAFKGGAMTGCSRLAVIDSVNNTGFQATSSGQVTGVTFSGGFNFGTLVTTIDLISGSVVCDECNLVSAYVRLRNSPGYSSGPPSAFVVAGGDARGMTFLPDTASNINYVSIASGVQVSPVNASSSGGTALPSPWNDQQGTLYLTSPTTGATVTAPIGTRQSQLTPSGGLSTLTQVFPPSPNAADKFCVASTQAISSVTFSGGTVVGAPGSLSANAAVCFVFDGTNWDKQ